ncbi:MAG: isopentenyl-diphosphate Delta-isomerase [Pseudomonadota bacterium]
MNDAAEHVILVDRDDREIGTAPKLEVHKTGALHRAFSVFGFNRSGEMLLQRRAMIKYHSPGLWANMCCGHPRPGEPIMSAAKRRTFEELGFKPDLFFGFTTLYKSDVGSALIEHEFVHGFGCLIDDLPKPNPREASKVRFASIDQIVAEMEWHPQRFAAWFRIYFATHLNHIRMMAERICLSSTSVAESA